MTPFSRVPSVLGLVLCRRPAAVLMLLAPAGIWLATMAGSASAQEAKTPPAGRYTAESILRVAMQEQPIMGGAVPWDGERYQIYRNTQKQLLLTRLVLRAALRKPDVAKLPSVQQAVKAGDAPSWLKQRLNVDFPGNSELMEVCLTSDDPKEAVILVNAVVDAYLTEIVNADKIAVQQRLSELDRAYTIKETEIRDKMTDLKQLTEKLGTDEKETLSLKQKLALEELTLYRQELSRVQFDVRRAATELAAQQAALKAIDKMDVADAEVDFMAQTDPVTRTLFEQLGFAAIKEAYNSPGRTSPGKLQDIQGPAGKDKEILDEQYKARKAQLIELVKQRKRAMAEMEIVKLGSNLAALKEQEKELRSEAETKAKEAETFGRANVDVEMLRADIKNLRTMLATIAAQRDKLAVEIREVSRITLLQPAELPDNP